MVRLILEAYYEPVFSSWSHGFRKGRGCHTALREVRDTWTGTVWFIEGDISDCFGSVDHEILMRILAEKIQDQRFLRLIRGMLRAGYLEDWEFRDTLSGTPQGGVVSPVLSNIYLHKLDEFVERELIPQYTRGEHRAPNPEYQEVKHRLRNARRHGDRAAARDLRRQLRAFPAGDPMDPGYRRLFYCRYADDHLLGFIGPKAEAEQIKAELARFLRETLALELNPDKTLITHARTQPARFLGYDIIVQHCNTQITHGLRSANGKVALRVPPDVVKAQCARYRSRGKPWHRSWLQNLPDYDIVRIYGAEYRGVVNYYLLAQDVCAARHLALDRPDIDAEDPGRQAQVHRHQDGRPVHGEGHHSRRPQDLLRGQDPAAGQEGPGSTIRRDPPQARQARGHHRPRPSPGHHPAQGADPPAPQAAVRAMRARRHGGSPPGHRARQPRQARTGPARMGRPHDQDAAQDAHRLRHLP